LRLHLEFVRELAHLPLHFLLRFVVLPTLELLALLLERIPHLDHALGLEVRISLDPRLMLNAGEQPLGALRPFELVHGAVYLMLVPKRIDQVLGGPWPVFVHGFAGLPHLDLLMFENRQVALVHPPRIHPRPRIPIDRLMEWRLHRFGWQPLRCGALDTIAASNPLRAWRLGRQS
jgi:hypothetical protein